MESNLTLPILCAYLPYKVKMYHPKTAEYIKSKGLTYHPTFLRGITSEVLIWVGTDNNSKHITEDGYKLLLRPLSDLTKPIKELDGKTPMQAVKSALWKERYGWPRIWLNSEYTEGKDGVVLIPTDSGVSIRCVPDYYMIPLSAFEIVRNVLLSLHFDLYGGIESGWALPLTAKQD